MSDAPSPINVNQLAGHVLADLDSDDLRLGIRQEHHTTSMGGRGVIARIVWSDILSLPRVREALITALDEQGIDWQ